MDHHSSLAVGTGKYGNSRSEPTGTRPRQPSLSRKSHFWNPVVRLREAGSWLGQHSLPPLHHHPQYPLRWHWDREATVCPTTPKATMSNFSVVSLQGFPIFHDSHFVSHHIPLFLPRNPHPISPLLLANLNRFGGARSNTDNLSGTSAPFLRLLHLFDFLLDVDILVT